MGLTPTPGFPIPLPSNNRKPSSYHKKRPTRQPPTQKGMRLAKKLKRVWREVSEANGVHNHQYPLITTARDFDQLLQLVEGDIDRVEKVVDWYILHHKEEWVPKAMIGKGFYYKFSSIENAMQRWEKANPKIRVKRKFKDIAAESFGVIAIPSMLEYWSPEFVKLFPLALQQTHENYSKFFNWVWSSEDYSQLYGNRLSHPDEFVIDWWRELDQWFLEIEHRKINPLTLIFDFTNKRTKKWIYSWSNQHSFAPDTPKRLQLEYVTSTK